MKKIVTTTVALAVLMILVPSAQAVIKIEVAEQQNGVAFIKGSGAALGAQIAWEGSVVTTANRKNGGFSFFGVVPEDCSGILSDGTEDVPVSLLNCTPVPTHALVPATGQSYFVFTGEDGDLKKGVAWPEPRFTDNGNGTITDNLTELVWLKNASCGYFPQTM